ncbi:GDSL-type esterase/lipase family protein [Paenibacillus turpanensis]|uniref:GDSL-type esterase/lipase family protein n=1 Tax=Paenibacillus turpanensis TaxID=2689078 RepID=UPI00140D2239|nr:GDSL-type esterase/lipase family protein [Paenibacillus turpanensis]
MKYKYNFTDEPKEGYVSVPFEPEQGAPLYQASTGYGFVMETCAIPAREVHVEQIQANGSGFTIQESSFFAEQGLEQDHYNHFGMAFRLQAEPGAYRIYVKTTSNAADTTVSVSAMQGTKLVQGGHWDAAKLVPVKHYAEANGNEWTFAFANGRSFIEIEIEPKHVGTPVGIQEIVLEPIALEPRESTELPTVFLLGDSTVKSYIFEEAPMSGWGQVIDRLFDPKKVRIVNYSMGGRSFKNAYTEGRFNDLVLSGNVGDYVLIQFGHNDERADEHWRFGRGSIESSYETYIREVYIPAVRARGMLPVLVTPMSRVLGAAQPGHVYTDSFVNRRFPEIMRKVGAELGIPVVDLNARSVEYYNEIGVEATTALFMSIEAGETPGKTNDGSYANGHPSNKIDGTHYKEALSKQFARLVVAELVRLGGAGDRVAGEIAAFLKDEVLEAVESGDWSGIYPEMTTDTLTGQGSYYRNQIEKLRQLGVMQCGENGSFEPSRPMMAGEFMDALGKVLGHSLSAVCAGYERAKELSREVMGAILYDAYMARFENKPKYMTDYNGKTVKPGDAGYDPNLDTGAAATGYDTMVSYDRLTDTAEIDPQLADKVKAAYELGLFRSEKGIVRGKMMNGTELEPKLIVTRAKAAKALYFMWVLAQPVGINNDVSTLQ